MEIQKIYSEIDTDERIYSVLLSEDEYRMFASAMTRYDMTDQYKTMKDSDILAEKDKSNLGTYVKAGKIGAIGAGVGGALGATGAAIAKSDKIVGALGEKGGVAGKIATGMADFARNHKIGLKRGAQYGAAIGGTLALAGGLAATHKEREKNRFANNRLNQMKYQAERRDSRDWRTQTNNREGYTM